MAVDVVDLKAFYARPLGATAARLVGEALARLGLAGKDGARGERVLGIGYTVPYLPAISDGAERVAAFMPAAQGVHSWPDGEVNRAALVENCALPLPDAFMDRILVVHGLEMAGDARRFLREVWRVLAPGGRLVVVAPNRRGLWARIDTTPFGYGQPYSRAQLVQLLRESMFGPRAWESALHVPPVSSRLVLRWPGGWERVGLRAAPRFAGVIAVEAVKELVAPIGTIERGRYPRILKPVLAPGTRPASRARPPCGTGGIWPARR